MNVKDANTFLLTPGLNQGNSSLPSVERTQRIVGAILPVVVLAMIESADQILAQTGAFIYFLCFL